MGTVTRAEGSRTSGCGSARVGSSREVVVVIAVDGEETINCLSDLRKSEEDRTSWGTQWREYKSGVIVVTECM